MVVHNYGTPIQPKWKEVTNDNDEMKGYKKYTETLPSKRGQVIALSIISFGIYYLVLRCTKGGRDTLANLKGRTVIHYVEEAKGSGSESKAAQKAKNKGSSSKTASKSHVTGTNTLGVNLDKLNTQILNNVFEDIGNFNQILNNLKTVVQTDKMGMLIQDLRKSGNKELVKDIEKFLKQNEADQTSYSFLEHISKWLKNDDVINLLQKSAKKVVETPKKKTEVEKARDDFREKFDVLKENNKLEDWLYSFKDDKDKLDFACKLVEASLWRWCTSDFSELYNSKKDLIDECIKEIDQVNEGASPEAPEEFKEEMQKYIKEYKKLYKEVTTSLNESVDYSLKNYFEATQSLLFKAKLKAFIDIAPAANPLWLINSYLMKTDGHPNEFALVFASVTPENKEKATQAAAEAAEAAKKEKIRMEGLLNEANVQNSFKKLKELSQNYKDILSLLGGSAPLLRVKYGFLFKPEFIDMCQKVINNRYQLGDTPTVGFVKTFEKDFPNIKSFEEALMTVDNMRKK